MVGGKIFPDMIQLDMYLSASPSLSACGPLDMM